MILYLLGGIGVALLAVMPKSQEVIRRAAFQTGVKPKPKPLSWSTEPYRAMLEEASQTYKIFDVQLLACVLLQESKIAGSGGVINPNASRYEPDYQAKYITSSREFNLDGARKLGWTDKDLATSWGLMQLLGGTVWTIRWLGWSGTIKELLEPKTNIRLGAKYLGGLLDRNNRNYTAALLKYNGGANPNYPIEVLARLRQMRAGKL